MDSDSGDDGTHDKKYYFNTRSKTIIIKIIIIIFTCFLPFMAIKGVMYRLQCAQVKSKPLDNVYDKYHDMSNLNASQQNYAILILNILFVKEPPNFVRKYYLIAELLIFKYR